MRTISPHNTRRLIAAGLSAGLAANVLAANVDWRGAFGSNWNSTGNWCPTGVPGSTDHAFIESDTTACGNANATCTLNISGTTSLGAIDLAGADPTKMTLQLQSGALDVNGLANFEDYASLDADYAFTADESDMVGDVWIDVADEVTVDLGTTLDILGTIYATPTSFITSTLHLIDNSAGRLIADEVNIDADAAGGGRGFKLDGANSTFEILSGLNIISGQSTGSKAKLWVGAGTIKIDNGTTGNAVLFIDGGTSQLRSVLLDIDDTLTAEETMFSGDDTSNPVELSYTGMDVASGKEFKAGKLIFEAGVIMNKQGPGTFRSGN